MSTKRLILYFSVLFLVVAGVIYSIFIINGTSLLVQGDGFRQGCFNILNHKHVLNSLFSGDGIPQWNWSKALGGPNKYNPDPFDLIPILLPIKYLEIGISIAVILKLYFGGLAFLLFAREMKMTNFQCIIGPVCYAFTTWFVNNAIIQSVFLFTVYMLPLIFLSIDWVCRGKSPLLFIASVAYTLIRGPYIAYMIAIVAILFMFLRYFAYNESFSYKNYFAYVGKFVCYGLVAGMLSAVFSLPYISMILGASIDGAGTAAPAFFDPDALLNYGKMLVSYGLVDTYSVFGIPIMGLLVLPIAAKKLSLRNTEVLMTVILFFLSLSPKANSMFNGFSYPSGRWFVVLTFFLSWICVSNIDIVALRKRSSLIAMSAWLAILSIWTIAFSTLGIIDLSLRGTAFIIINLFAGAMIILVLAAFDMEKITIFRRQIAILAIACLTLMASWVLNFYLYQDSFLPRGYTADILEKSPQRVSTQIDDDDFYRTDQVDGVNFHKELKTPANESLWWQSKGLYIYDSLITPEQLYFNKYVGNNYGYALRVYTLSNDNRPGLDFLSGVRYFIGDDLKNGLTGADEYAGYGFDKIDSIDGVSIYKNKYDAGLGYAYDKYISESDFLKLSRLEREQALLQAIVIPDDKCGEVNGRIANANISDIETSVDRIGYRITDSSGIVIEGNRIIVENDAASMTLETGAVENSQLFLSFDNLQKTEKASFTIDCNTERLHEEVGYLKNNQSLPEITDFDMNFGYYDKESCRVQVSFSKKGEYTFDDMYFSAMNVDIYDKYAEERMASAFDVQSYSSDYVQGSIAVQSDNILFFSIPRHTYWDVYVDGKKAEKISNANIAFIGVEITEGEHQIELKYNSKPLTYGLIASISAIIIILVAIFISKRRRA